MLWLNIRGFSNTLNDNRITVRKLKNLLKETKNVIKMCFYSAGYICIQDIYVYMIYVYKIYIYKQYIYVYNIYIYNVYRTYVYRIYMYTRYMYRGYICIQDIYQGLIQGRKPWDIPLK